MNICDIVSFFPETDCKTKRKMPSSDTFSSVVSNDFLTPPHHRHLAYPGYTSVELATEAVSKLLKRNNLNPDDIDLILNFSVYSDHILPGDAMEIARRSGLHNAEAINIEDGCCSYITMLNIARLFVMSGQKRKVLITTVTNFISRLDSFKNERVSQVLGDGATATLIDNNYDTPAVVDYIKKTNLEASRLFLFRPDNGKEFWETNSGEVSTSFNPHQFTAIKHMLNELPCLVIQLLEKTKTPKDSIDYLITHQPNASFLSHWGVKLGMEDIHFDTFNECGNLFHSSIPASLAKLYENKIMGGGDKLIVISAFSYAGESVSAMLLRI